MNSNYCVVVTVDSSVVSGVKALLKSLIMNNKWYNGKIFLVDCGTTESERDEITSCIPHEVSFYEFPEELSTDNKLHDFKVAAFLLSEHGFDYVLTLGADMIVRGDIKKLFTLDKGVYATKKRGRTKKADSIDPCMFVVAGKHTLDINCDTKIDHVLANAGVTFLPRTYNCSVKSLRRGKEGPCLIMHFDRKTKPWNKSPDTAGVLDKLWYTYLNDESSKQVDKEIQVPEHKEPRKDVVKPVAEDVGSEIVVGFLSRFEADDVTFEPVIQELRKRGITVKHVVFPKTKSYRTFDITSQLRELSCIVTGALAVGPWSVVRDACIRLGVKSVYLPHGRLAEFRSPHKAAISLTQGSTLPVADYMCAIDHMYKRYAESCGWSTKVVLTGSPRLEYLAGYKNVSREKILLYVPLIKERMSGTSIGKNEYNWDMWVRRSCSLGMHNEIAVLTHYRDWYMRQCVEFCNSRKIPVRTTGSAEMIAKASVVVCRQHTGVVYEANVLGKPVVLMDIADRDKFCNTPVWFDNKSIFWRPTVNGVLETARELHRKKYVAPPLPGDVLYRDRNAINNVCEVIIEACKK